MLDTVRKALRISGEYMDDEIKDTISACYKDMARVGISVFNKDGTVKRNVEADPLVISCQKMYARWQFNFENAAERYMRAYENCRDGMALCGDYHA